MCLSPEVDLVAGVAIAVVAVDAVRHNRHGRTLPLALLPAVFAVHTLTEAFIWWGERGVVPAQVGDAAAVFFMFVAFVLLPVYVPVSVLLIEPRGWRRDALLLLTGAGAIAAADFLIGLVSGRAEATACSYFIDYRILGAATVSGGLYVLATCGAMLLSGQRPLQVWGVTNVVVVAALIVWQSRGLPSLWCFWAAMSSVFVAVFLRRLAREQERGEAPPWAPPAREDVPTGAGPP